MQEQEVQDAPSETELFKLIDAKIVARADDFAIPPREDFVSPVAELKLGNGLGSAATSVEEDTPPVVATVKSSTLVPFQATSDRVVTSFDLKKANKDGGFNFNVDGSDAPIKLDFPYMACVDYSDTCQAIKVCGNLFSPCLTKKSKASGDDYCKTCRNAVKEGQFKYGTLEERNACEDLRYTDPNNKKEISFGTYIKKRGVTQM